MTNPDTPDIRTDQHIVDVLTINEPGATEPGGDQAEDRMVGQVHVWQGQGHIALLGLWADGREWISITVPDTPPPGSTPPDQSTILDSDNPDQ